MFIFSVVGSGKWRLSNWSGGCWALLGFFFAVSSAASHTVLEKMIFGSGKSFLIVGEWRLLGIAGTGKLPGKKWFLGWENHFVKLESGGCWDLLGFFLRCLYCCLQDCRARRVAVAGICWDFFFCGVYCCLAECRRKKWFFGWGKWFFWNWRLAIAGFCWDFFFCGVYCCLASCPAKKWFWGLENHCEIGEWRLVICWDFSFFALSIAAWQTALGRGNDSVKLESGDCWDLLGFLLLRCRLLLGGLPGKKNDFWVGKIIFLKLETSDCWDLMGFLLLRCPGKKWFWVGKITFLKRLLGFAGISPFLRCLLLLGRLPGKKWFLGRGNHFSEIGEWRFLGFAGISSFTVSTAAWRAAWKKMIFGSGKSFFWSWRLAIAGIWWDFFFCGVRAKSDFWVGKITFLKRLLGFAGISPFLRCLLLLGRLPGKKWFLGRGNHFLKLENGDCWDLLGFLLLRCRLLLGGLPGKKKIFGSGKSFFWSWRLAVAGIWWDFFFCGVYCQRDWLY